MKKTNTPEIFYKIRDAFPEIEKYNVKLIFDNNTGISDFTMIDENTFLYKNKIEPAPKIYLGKKFFSLDENVQFAIIGHELGHHNYFIKNMNPEKVERTLRWAYTLNCYIEGFHDLIPPKEKEKLNEHWLNRLQNWNMMLEIDADNFVIEKGYANGLLLLLEKFQKETRKQYSKEELKRRIKNLEAKLA